MKWLWLFLLSGMAVAQINNGGTSGFATYVGGSLPQIGTSADMGAQINAAYAALPATGGEIILLPQTGGGCYNFSTPIAFVTSGKYIALAGGVPVSVSGGTSATNPSGGACLNFTTITSTCVASGQAQGGSSPCNAITVDYTPSIGGGYTGGNGLFNLALTNGTPNGCVTNGGCGSTAVGVATGTTNSGAQKMMLDNVRVSGFGTGFNLSDTAGASWGMLWINSSFVWDTTGVFFGTYHENMAWMGGACAVVTTCVNFGATASFMNFQNVSFDSVVGTTFTGTMQVTCNSCYAENLNVGTNAFQLASINGGFFDYNGEINNDNTSGSSPALSQFVTAAGAATVELSGTNIYSGGQNVTAILNNTAGGSGWIDYGTTSTAQIPVGCTVPTQCIVTRRGLSPIDFSLSTLSLPAATLATTPRGSYVTCRMDSTNNNLQCNYNNGGANFLSIPRTIASGTTTLTSGAITAATCQTAVTTAATNVQTTDSIEWAYATAPTVTTDALLNLSPYVTSGNVNFTRCNPTAAGITGTAIVVNWRVFDGAAR